MAVHGAEIKKSNWRNSELRGGVKSDKLSLWTQLWYVNIISLSLNYGSNVVHGGDSVRKHWYVEERKALQDMVRLTVKVTFGPLLRKKGRSPTSDKKCPQGASHKNPRNHYQLLAGRR